MAVRSPVASHPVSRRTKPLLGLRRQPGRLALAVFRLPLPLYRRGWGRLLGHTFLLLVHAGRKTGKLRSTVVMVLRYKPETREAVICSVWGQNTDWIRNIRVRPALQVQIGRESFTPEQRFLSEDESFAVSVEFRRRHPWRLRLFNWILGWRISARIRPQETSCALGRSCHCVRTIPPDSEIVRVSSSKPDDPMAQLVPMTPSQG
ncbi:MAG: nitroreductase family deazaflavin-dependent oxidoreductase [Candidatus Limnocylindrales bacterium]